MDELSVLRIMAEQPTITRKELVARIGKSVRTVKSLTVALQEKGHLVRENGKRNGRWVVTAPLDG